MKYWKLALSFGVAAGSFGCGGSLPSWLDGSSQVRPKMPCPGDHTGFFVCMSDSSQISDQALAKTLSTSLTQLATLVNSSTFQKQISTAFTDGQSIDQNLGTTNYIVTITGYCDASTNTLAQAAVGGDTIQYNECRVQHDANGQPDESEVAGVLLHEISHNIGYTHPDVNPSRSTVPYYLGDTVTADLGGSTPTPGYQTSSAGNTSSASAAPLPTNGRSPRRHNSTWGD